jgi:hypothetical protein
VKAGVAIAVVLGIVAIVLGIVALKHKGGPHFSDEQTLELTGENEERIDFNVDTNHKEHPLEGWTAVRDVSGDATGEYAVTCVPLARDDIECSGGFQLEGGDIEVEGTEEATDDGQATTGIVGGTGDYHGAAGSVDIDFEADTYSLTFHVIEE